VTNESEVVIQLAQKCLESMPVIVLGSGASIPYGIGGMQELKDHLLKTVTASAEDAEAWNGFKESLNKTRDLEQSLQETTLPNSLLASIIRQTRASVIAKDLEVFTKLITNPQEIALTRLYRYLFNSTHGTLSVVTTNYDRLAEYAADAAGFSHNTGFTNGYYRSFSTQTTSSSRTGPSRTIEVWKVHGSVDWYVDEHQIAIALPFAHEYPSSLKPLLVTPGATKYEQTHYEPFRTIMARADLLRSARRMSGFEVVHIGSCAV
jgi:SIR2-like domain